MSKAIGMDALQMIEEFRGSGTPMIDLRPLAAFARGHVPGAVNIPYTRTDFIAYVADALPPQPVVLLDDIPAVTREAERELEAHGYPVVAVLVGGTRVWQSSGRPLEQLDQVTVDELAAVLRERPGHVVVLDVREGYERVLGAIPGTVHIPLGLLPEKLEELDPSREYVLVCASGSRSSVAQGYLHRHGFRKVKNLVGGMNLWMAAGHPTEGL